MDGSSGCHSDDRSMSVVESYIYDDGAVRARVDRIEPGLGGASKSFLPYVWNGPEGRYNDKPGLDGVKLPLYHVDEVHAAAVAEQAVFIVEGEGRASVQTQRHEAWFRRDIAP